jgi:hypothetical protein
MRKILVALTILYAISMSATQNVAFSWTLSVTPGVTGQRMYCGSVSGGPYTQKWPAVGTWANSTVRTHTIGFGMIETHYCVFTTLGPTGESGPSNEVVFTTVS